MQTEDDPGIITRPAARSVNDTVATLLALLKQRGITLFALVDHSGEAAKAGLKMPPTKLLIFGNPAAGTPVMRAAPTSAIDLPLKLLAWEDVDGKTWLSYNDPTYLQNRHHLPTELLRNISVAGDLADHAAR
ncbi:MAG: hypothetical protein QOE14_2480 [Humisphaera sp.]|nr:hypothetical protein [Humisphaera sp.]